MLASRPMDRPLLILSDTHLSRDYGSPIAQDLHRLFRENSGAEIILNGDILDLSLDPAERKPVDSLQAAMAPHPDFVAALSTHLAHGGKLTLIPGNHDAGLSAEGQIEHLKRSLNAPNDECLEVQPWFARRGDVHIEHGHLYDPDCAPNHPLADPNPRSEGLGTALMRRFISPNDAHFFAHVNQVTPSSGLKTAFEKWGVRAPLVIVDYFRTAITLCVEAAGHKSLVSAERLQGEGRLLQHAQHTQLHPEILEALLRLAPLATHHDLSSTFLRLYFDRILAGTALATGVGLLGSAGLAAALSTTAIVTAGGALTSSGLLLTLLGGGYLTHSIGRDKNRYANAVIGQLGDAAQRVREVTESRLVIMGHTHVEVDVPGYVNLGSFGFGRRRPYLMVDTNGKHERRYLA